jgi:hypothetical protein
LPAPASGDPDPSTSTSYPLLASDFSLAISPTRVVVGPDDFDSTPRILVVNRGRRPLDIVAADRDYVSRADGAMIFRDGAPYSASSWVTESPASFRLEPGTARPVTLRIAVPADPEPGDHQVAVVFVVPAKHAGPGNVRINRAIAAPVYITVPGKADDSATISGLDAPGFVMDGPVDLTASVHNTGTVHRDFRGTRRLGVDAAGQPQAFPDFTVTRDAVRDISTTWEPPLLCVCHPTVSFTNADGTRETATARVIVFPMHLLAILAGVALLVFAIMRLRRRAAKRDGAHAK